MKCTIYTSNSHKHHQKLPNCPATGMYSGNPEEGESVVQPLRELAAPIIDQTSVLSYVEMQSKLDAMIQDHIPVYGTGLYLGDLGEELIAKLLEKMNQSPSPGFIFQLWGLSGQMNRVEPMATPFAIREAKYALLVDVMAVGPVDGATCEDWIQSVYDEFLAYSVRKASYLNGIGVDDQVTKNAFAENYSRLQEIKKKYDPDNVFRFNHNIK